MRLAILTDIHANREAFEAVLADLAIRRIDRLALLGDIRSKVVKVANVSLLALYTDNKERLRI